MLIMKAIIKGTINGQTFEEYEKSGYGLSIGSFTSTVIIKGKEQIVNFDWDSFNGKILANDTLLCEMGTGGVLKSESELANYYDNEYIEAGFSREDLTAKVLASAIRIDEFNISCILEKPSNLSLVEMSFIDDTGEYYVKKDIPCKFYFND